MPNARTFCDLHLSSRARSLRRFVFRQFSCVPSPIGLPVLKAGVAMAGGDDAGEDAKQRYALNVIPTEARAGFDVRIDPNTPTEDFKARLAGWCKEGGVTWELADWTTPLHEHYLTSVDRDENPWWGVFLVSLFVSLFLSSFGFGRYTEPLSLGKTSCWVGLGWLILSPGSVFECLCRPAPLVASAAVLLLCR